MFVSNPIRSLDHATLGSVELNCEENQIVCKR